MSAFLSIGGPMQRISVDGEIIEFEMHPWCGPNILDGNDSPIDPQPERFLQAASLWAQQGQKVDGDGLCLWYEPGVPITKHLGGRHHQVTGHTEPRRGS